MKLWSDSWSNGERIPARFACGRLDAAAGTAFSDNVSPHLAWSDLPAATKSLVLICHDFDVPSRGDDVNKSGREIPADLPRVDFFHWLLADVPVATTSIPEGAFSHGFTAKGKPGPAVSVPGFAGARQGINDFTGWFAGNPALAGDYFGYDGPYPPWNDSLVHHYVFTLYALAIARAPVEGRFGGAELRKAIDGHVLAEAMHSGSYTLNRRLLAS
jgi:Raf kinase inhibitor-like YbhB/YbcL family protein